MDGNIMRAFIAGVALAFAFASAQAAEDDAAPDTIKDFIKGYEAAFASCDLDRFTTLHHEDFKGFSVRGPLGIGVGPEGLKIMCEAGFKMSGEFDLQWHRPLGDGYLLALHYLGTLERPDGTTSQNNGRFTIVLTRSDDTPRGAKSEDKPKREYRYYKPRTERAGNADTQWIVLHSHVSGVL